MDIHKLTHSSDQIQAVFDMATGGAPTTFTETLGLSQWSEIERNGVEILKHVSEDNQKIEDALHSVNISVDEIDECIQNMQQQVTNIDFTNWTDDFTGSFTVTLQSGVTTTVTQGSDAGGNKTLTVNGNTVTLVGV